MSKRSSPRIGSPLLPLLGAVLLAGLPSRAAAQDEEGGAEGEETAVSQDEKDAKYFAIVGGDVYTGTGAILRGATLLARNGKIKEIGYDVFLPEGTQTLDAVGLRVYPGMIALGANGRITAGTGSADESGADGGELEPENEILWDGLVPVPGLASDAEGASDLQADEEGGGDKSEIEDTFDPFNSFLVLSLATGITTAQQSSAAVKLKRNEIDGVLLGERHLAAVPWDLGNPSGIQGTRKKFARAAEYLRELRAWRERAKKDEKEPSRKGVDTTANRILSGEALAYFRASRREEILGIARFAQEFGFRPVIEGCDEGWTVADELGRAGAFAIVSPRHRNPKEEHFTRPGGASIENAAILYRSGVQVALRPDSTTIDFVGTAGRDLIALPVEAGFAVRGGLSEQAALEGVTIVPARVLGVDSRVGSLEVGKDCDAIVTDGDLLHYQTFVQYTVVDGKLVYDKEQEIYFAHIRPRPKAAVEAPAGAAGDEKAGTPSSEEPGPGDEAKDEPTDEQKPGKDQSEDESEPRR